MIAKVMKARFLEVRILIPREDMIDGFLRKLVNPVIVIFPY